MRRIAKRLIPAVEFFNRNYKVDPHSGCWIWTGPLSHWNNMPALKMRVKRGHEIWKSAHRFAYMIRNGDRQKGNLIHLCDTKGCVNPEHYVHEQDKERLDKLSMATTSSSLINMEVLDLSKYE